MSDLSLMQEEGLSESDLFDQLTTNTFAEPDQEIAANEQAELLLALVSPEDQQILMLAFVQGFEREALAQKLGISPGATRVRLHRALKRLRLAWSEQHLNDQKEKAMNEQLTPEAQRHLQVLQRYMLAMESGDIDSMSLVLREAEVDPALEKMIFEVNDFYQQEDHTVADAVDVMQAQQLLHDALPATSQNAIPAFSSESIETSESVPEKTPDTIHSLMNSGSQEKKAPTQVLPSRKVAPQKWYQTRRNWFLAAIAAILVALLLLPNSGALASQLLSLFRIQQFQPVQVTQPDVQSLSSRPIPTFQDMGTLQIQSDSLQTQDNLTQAQAAQMVNFSILVPQTLPQGISGTPDFSVIDAGHGTFTFSASKAHAFFVKNGYGDVHIPSNLDGATYDVTTTAGVVISYGNQTTTQFMIVEFPSPVVRATGSASLQELRDVALSIPGLPPQLVTQLKQIDLNSGVVPLPIPSGIDSQSITVHSTQGLLLTKNISTTIPQLKKFPAGSAVIWQTHGIIYAVGGTISNTNQLLNSANSLN